MVIGSTQAQYRGVRGATLAEAKERYQHIAKWIKCGVPMSAALDESTRLGWVAGADQHQPLETVIVEGWEDGASPEKRDCVYQVLANGKTVWVGLSGNLKSRLRQHRLGDVGRACVGKHVVTIATFHATGVSANRDEYFRLAFVPRTALNAKRSTRVAEEGHRRQWGDSSLATS